MRACVYASKHTYASIKLHPPHSRHTLQVDLLFQRFDRDGDKTLSKSEYRDYLEATGLWGRGPYVESAWEDEALWQRELGGLGSDSKRGSTCCTTDTQYT